MAKRTTARTRKIETVLKQHFPDVQAYEHNEFSIRIGIRDASFKGQDRLDREERVLPLLRQLPEDLQQDITMLALVAPGEESSSMLWAEFADPTPAMR